MKKIIAMALAFVMLIFCMAALTSCGGGSGSEKESGSAQSVNDVDTGDNGGEAGPEKPLELSDDLFDYTFRLGDKLYKLPCEPSEFLDDGWTHRSPEENLDREIESHDSVTAQMYHEEYGLIDIELYNPGADPVKLRDCKLGGISFNSSFFTGSFTLSKGVNESSTEEDIVAALGEPDSKSDSVNDTTNLMYDEYAPDESPMYNSRVNCRYVIRVYNPGADKTGFRELSIYNMVNDPVPVEATVAEGEAPAYLADYAAPAELGTDATTGVFMLAGDLYQLPCPYSVFEENGWVPADPVEGQIASMEKGTRYMIEKDGLRATINLKNFSQYPADAKNCAVYNVTVEAYKGADIELPGGIKRGMPEADVGPIVGDEFKHTEGLSYSYMSTTEQYFCAFYIYVDAADHTVNKFNLTVETWNY